jgi:hypothetical protein
METVKKWMPGGSGVAPVPAPGGVPPPNDQTPWWLSTLARAVGSVAGLVCLFVGLLSLFAFSLVCIASGAILMVEGLVVTLIEAPCFCVFLDFSQVPGGFFDKRPHWVRATVYLCFAVIPFSLCVGFMAFFGCGLLMITSALYLIIGLGKKASLDEMRVKASNMSSAPTAVLVNNEEKPAFTPLPDVSFNQTNKPVVY